MIRQGHFTDRYGPSFTKTDDILFHIKLHMQVGTYYIGTIKQLVPMGTERAYAYRNVWTLKIVKYNYHFFQVYEFYEIIT